MTRTWVVRCAETGEEAVLRLPKADMTLLEVFKWLTKNDVAVQVIHQNPEGDVI